MSCNLVQGTRAQTISHTPSSGSAGGTESDIENALQAAFLAKVNKKKKPAVAPKIKAAPPSKVLAVEPEVGIDVDVDAPNALADSKRQKKPPVVLPKKKLTSFFSSKGSKRKAAEEQARLEAEENTLKELAAQEAKAKAARRQQGRAKQEALEMARRAAQAQVCEKALLATFQCRFRAVLRAQLSIAPV